MNKRMKKISNVAAIWWRNIIDPMYNDTLDEDVAYTSRRNENCNILDKTILDKFQTTLADVLYEKLNEKDFYLETLSCDTHPEGLLKEVLESIGLKKVKLPKDTCMWITKRGIKLREYDSVKDRYLL